MHHDRAEPASDNDYQARHAAIIADSYARLTGRRLVGGDNEPERACALYHAPFVVLAHDTAPDPVFFYGNLAAQSLFAMPWEQLVALPSRLSAEPINRDERQRLLDRVRRFGYIDDYAGIRVAGDGRRFRIGAATVWTLCDERARNFGQAATFGQWETL